MGLGEREAELRESPASCAALPLSVLRQSCSFNRKKTCFDSSPMRCALRCLFPAVCMGVWLLSWVTDCKLWVAHGEERGLCPAERCGEEWAHGAGFALPLGRGTAGFRVRGALGATVCRHKRGAPQPLCSVCSSHSISASWKVRGETTQKAVVLHKACAS